MKTHNIIAVAVLGCAFAVPVIAEDSIDIDGYVGIASDYRDRGISMSNDDPALMGSLSLFHDSGLYAGVDLAQVDAGIGGDARTEFFAGYTIDAGDFVYDLSVELDGIHGGGSDYYPELRAAVSRDFGLAYIRSGLAFSPEGRWNTPDIDSWYAFTDLEVPVPTMSEITLVSRLGYDIRDGRSNLWDWAVGFSVFVDSFELTLMYKDSSLDDPAAKGKLIFGTRFYF